MSIISERRLILLDPGKLDTNPDAPYRTRYRLPGEEGESEEDRRLTESIGLHGVIEPPLLLGKPDDPPESLVILRGFRRIAAARTAGLDRIEALLLPNTSLEEREIIRLIHSDDPDITASSSDFDQTYEIIHHIRSKGTSLDEYVKVLDMSKEIITELVGLFDLPEETLEAWRSGVVTEGDLLEFNRHGMIDTVEAVSLLSGENFNGHERQQAVSLMLTIADRGKDKWKEFYEAQPRRRGDLLQALRKACYPSMSRDRGAANKIVKEMRLPPGVTISPPENMEGSWYRFTMMIRNEEKLAETITKLSTALEEGKIKKLLDILKGRVQGDASG